MRHRDGTRKPGAGALATGLPLPLILTFQKILCILQPVRAAEVGNAAAEGLEEKMRSIVEKKRFAPKSRKYH